MSDMTPDPFAFSIVVSCFSFLSCDILIFGTILHQKTHAPSAVWDPFILKFKDTVTIVA